MLKYHTNRRTKKNVILFYKLKFFTKYIILLHILRDKRILRSCAHCDFSCDTFHSNNSPYIHLYRTYGI